MGTLSEVACDVVAQVKPIEGVLEVVENVIIVVRG